MVEKCNQTMERVDHWMEQHGLMLAPEIVVFSMRRMTGVSFKLRGTELHPRMTEKYLGVTLDRHLTFGCHIQEVCDKAERTMMTRARLMPNIGGPSSKKRKVLANVVSSILLYAAPVWTHGLKIRRHRNRVASVQRKAAIRVTITYRTVSTDATLVISGKIPIRLLAQKRENIFEDDVNRVDREKLERVTTFRKWQQEYDSSQEGRCTRKLIQDVRA